MKYKPYKEYKARIKTLKQLKSEFTVIERTSKITHSTGMGGGLSYRNVQLTKFFGQIVTIEFHREAGRKKSRYIFHWKNDRYPLYDEWCEWIEDPETLLKLKSDILPSELFEI